MKALKLKAKSVLAVFLCLVLVLGEVVLFPMNSKAEAISQGAPLLDISVGEEFIIEDGGSEIRQFPFLASFDDDVFVSMSQNTDTEWTNHGINGVKISRDDGATWNEYMEESDNYFTSLIKLSSGTLFGMNYTSYYIDERHSTAEYMTSEDGGRTWEKHTGTVTFPQDVGKYGDQWASMVFHRSMMEMPDGSIQGVMYGQYNGDADTRVIWVKSTDGGQNWSVVSNVAVPSGVSGEPTVYCEPTVARCSDGSLLCVMRIGNLPLYQCRSNDNGLSWSKPEQLPGITDTDAYSVDPQLYLMSNGVLVLSYGRPHCKMLFSADGMGNEWTDLQLTYTDTTSGYTGISEVEPNKLLLIGDTGADWQTPESFKIWGKYVEVHKTNVALEDGVDAGNVDINGNTYTALPYEGNEFLGWYNSSGELVSNNITETFTEGLYTPKFKSNSIFKSPGFEYVDLGFVYTNDPNKAVYPNWYASADWATVEVVTSKANKSSRALKFFTHYRNDAYTDIVGLKPNTEYTVSYDWMMPEGYTAENNNCFYGMIASSTEYTTTSAAYSNNIGSTYGSYSPEAGVWKKHTFKFNTGDLTTVRLFVEYASAPNKNSNLYIDNLTVAKEPAPLSVSMENGVDAGYITNEGNTYTAVAYDGNEVSGWYNADGLISTESTYDFTDLSGTVTARFKNNSVFQSSGYELCELGEVKYTEHSSTASGWHIGASWGSAKVVDTVAHSGSKAIEVFARYQSDVYTNVTGLKPNTNYTVSYYWMMKESYSAANNNNFYGMIACSTEYDAIGGAYQNNIGNTYGNNYPEGGVWKKDFFTFNTGDLTAVRLFIEYSSANASVYIDEFTVFESPENLINYDADVSSGKIVNGGGSATVTEINTTLSDPAALENKVYQLDTAADFTIGYSVDTMLLKAGKRYDASLYFKVAEGHTMLSSNDAGQYVSFFMQKGLYDDTPIPLAEDYVVTIEPIGGNKSVYSTNATEFSIDKNHVTNEQGAPIWIKITASFTPSANMSAVFAIRPNAAGSVYVDKVKVTSAEDATEEIQSALSVIGTAIRTNGVQALRFKSEIEKSAISKLYFDTYELVEYGSVAIKTEYLNGEELKLGSYLQPNGEEKEAKKGAAYIKNQQNVVFEDTGLAIHFTAALTAIAEKNYNTSYSVRTYAVLQRPDGSSFVVYDAETVSATVYAVANAAYNAEGNNNGYAESEEVRNYLYDNILNKADFDKYPDDGFKNK